MHKNYGDLFQETELEHRLAERGVGRVVVTGAQTDACIRSTLHGAFVRGYDVTLVGDAHTTEDLSAYGAPPPEQVIRHTNLCWGNQGAPGRPMLPETSRSIHGRRLHNLGSMARRDDAKNPAKNQDQEDRKKRRIRGAMGRGLMKVPLLRRWYIRRTLKFIEKSKAKGRKLPEGMSEMARQLSQIPKDKQAQALEDALMAEQDMPNMSREFRRAAARKRLSTTSDTRYRTGRPPGAGRQQQRRQRPR